MSAAEIGTFAWQFATTLLLCVGWLILRRVLPGLRMRIGVSFSYCIAAALALIAFLLRDGGPTLYGFAASLLVIAVLYINWRRSLKRHSMDANTIIGYDSNIIF
jgi:hypothetical protein